MALQKKTKKANVGEDVEKLGLLGITGGGVKRAVLP